MIRYRFESADGVLIPAGINRRLEALSGTIRLEQTGFSPESTPSLLIKQRNEVQLLDSIAYRVLPVTAWQSTEFGVGPSLRVGPGSNSSLARDLFVIVPSDTLFPAKLPEAIWVGGGGVLMVETLSGNVVPIIAQTGQLIPVMIRRVLETGTTATGLTGLTVY